VGPDGGAPAHRRAPALKNEAVLGEQRGQRRRVAGAPVALVVAEHAVERRAGASPTAGARRAGGGGAAGACAAAARAASAAA
jgi:hypothetical protein